MNIRPVGDMTALTSLDDMSTEVQAVMAVVNNRLKLLQGEWWEDYSLGFSVPALIFESTRTMGTSLLSGFITAYIKDTEGVTSVSDVSAYISDRILHYSATIHTVYGDAKGEVTQDVLLRAIS